MPPCQCTLQIETALEDTGIIAFILLPNEESDVSATQGPDPSHSHGVSSRNRSYYHALTQQWPTGSGAASTLLGSLCLRTFGTETSFCQAGSFLSSICAVSVHVATPTLQRVTLDIRKIGVKWPYSKETSLHDAALGFAVRTPKRKGGGQKSMIFFFLKPRTPDSLWRQIHIA